MAKKTILTPLAAAIGTTFVVSLAASPIVNAEENPFALNELSSGFMVAGEAGKCGTICGGEAPTVKEGEIVKCGGVCGEVAKCGTLCGGFTESGEPSSAEGKDAEVAKCGNICAAAK
jgi:hypothetical protein